MNDEKFEIYSDGMCCMSICTNIEDVLRIEELANEKNPTGLDHGWSISKEKFKTGEDNPCQCNQDNKSKHYLLSC